MAFDFDVYIKLSAEDKDTSDFASLNLPALSGWADELLHPILEMYNRNFYIPQNGKLSLQWSRKKTFEAWITSDDLQFPFHTIWITETLVKQIAADSEAFTRYAIHRLIEPDFSAVWEKQGLTLDGVGVYPQGVNPSNNRQMMLNHGLTWIATHEIAHSLQSHAALRYGVPGVTWIGQSRVSEKPNADESCSDLEAEIFQATELAADYQALKGLIMGLIAQKREGFKRGQVSESFITLTDIWTVFTSIALVFLRFHNFKGKKFDGTVEGHHPHPAIRYLLLTQNLIGILLDEHLKDIGGYSLREIDLAQAMVHSFWVVIMFWADRYEKGAEVINFGEIMTDSETPEIRNYLQKIVSRWDLLRPIVKKSYNNEFFLMQFNIFVRRISGIPAPA